MTDHGKIKIYLEVLDDNNLMFRVLEQDGRCNLNWSPFKRGDGICLYSDKYPFLRSQDGKITSVGVRGTITSKNNAVTATWVKNALEEKKRILQVFDEYLNSLNRLVVEEVSENFYNIDKIVSFYLYSGYHNSNIVWGCDYLRPDLISNVDYKAKNGIYIKSVSCPSLSRIRLSNNIEVIYLLGRDSSRSHNLTARTVEDATNEKNRMLNALLEWSQTVVNTKYTDEELIKTNVFSY